MENRFRSPHVDDRHNFSDLLERTSAAMVKHLSERANMPVDCSVPPQSIRRKLMNLPLPSDGMAAEDVDRLLDRTQRQPSDRGRSRVAGTDVGEFYAFGCSDRRPALCVREQPSDQGRPLTYQVNAKQYISVVSTNNVLTFARP